MRALRERVRAIQAGAQEPEGKEGGKEKELGEVEEREERDDSDAVDIEWPLALMLVKRA